jgi:hypothetical protein
MTVFRALADVAQVVLVVSLACVFLMFVIPVAFMLFVLLVSEETMEGAMSLFILTFLALVLMTLVGIALLSLRIRMTSWRPTGLDSPLQSDGVTVIPRGRPAGLRDLVPWCSSDHGGFLSGPCSSHSATAVYETIWV